MPSSGVHTKDIRRWGPLVVAVTVHFERDVDRRRRSKCCTSHVQYQPGNKSGDSCKMCDTDRLLLPRSDMSAMMHARYVNVRLGQCGCHGR